MSLAVLYSRALSGMEAALVTVEAHIANGLPSFTSVGRPETEVKESKDRVRAALQNCQFDFPARRITVNLIPADLPKVKNISLIAIVWTNKMRAVAKGNQPPQSFGARLKSCAQCGANYL